MGRLLSVTFAAAVTLALVPLPPAIASGPATPASRVSAASAVPAQFTDTQVASLAGPTALAFMPDGRMLIATQQGRLRVMANGSLLTTPALDLSGRLCSNSERGLLGVAADPDAASSAFYLYYTFRNGTTCPTGSSTTPVNRVSRFVLRPDNTVDPATETVLLDNIPSVGGNHNAGDLEVGHDGNLYVSIGDSGCDYAGGGGGSGCGGSNNAARDVNVLQGKIARITRSGGIPVDNPFQGVNTASCRTGAIAAGLTCREIYATGLRNPFRIAFNPNTAATEFRINDVGQAQWEEVNQGAAGADYGWNVREGLCRNTGILPCDTSQKPAGLTDPVYSYGHADGCASITGGAYVPDNAWPAEFAGAYLFADYVCGKIFSLKNGVRTEFAAGLGGSSAVHLEFGPYAGSQALYYTTYAGGGSIRRIAYTGSTNRPPTAALTANPTSGAAPLAVTLNGGGSSDPDGQALRYVWTFGDGSPVQETTVATTSHTYASGTFTASLTVRDSGGLSSAPVTVRISSGNTAPQPVIAAPAASATFTVDGTYTLTGSATDAQDGALPPSALTWQIIRRHDSHTHPFLQPTTGNNLTFTAPGPEDLSAAATSYLEIQLSATDSRGTTTTVTRAFRPRVVPVTITTSPAGRAVTVERTVVTGPTTVQSWAGWRMAVEAAPQTDGAGRIWEPAGWSDGGAAAHQYLTPQTASTITARFTERPPLVVGAQTSIRPVTACCTDRLIRHRDALVFTDQVNAGSSALARFDSTWKVVAGLANPSCYSFESRNFPGEYLRHQDFRVRKDPDNGSALFRADATWCAQLNGAEIRFAASNFPSSYLRHINGEVWLATPGGPHWWDNPNLFTVDSTWAAVPPAVP